MSPLHIVLIALFLFSSFAAPLGGQAVQGTVTDRDTGRPVEGAIVHLLDHTDRSSAGSLTTSAGDFVLRTPAPGRFRLRVERIGFEDSFSEMLDLGPSEVRELRMEISPRAITLEGITARGRGRGCTIGENAETVARVWAEARKALDAVSLTQSGELVTFDIQSFRRELDPTTRQIRFEHLRSSFGRGDNPFRSIPISELTEHGYAKVFPDSTLYYAPDAAVLLSDQFLDGHCFRLSPDATEDLSLIGLEFRPRGRPSKPDIEGTLWLDRQSAALRFMEYRYVGLNSELPTRDVGGRIEFERVLPSGVWIVRRWHIRMPRVTVLRYRSQNHATGAIQEREEHTLSALVEEGGEVVSIHSARLAPASTDYVTLSGIVIDSLAGRPLGGATVYLSGTSFSARTDASGRYTIPAIPGGRYALSFTHPGLRALGVLPVPLQTELGSESSVTIDLATPSLYTVLERYCPALEGERQGMITGHVRDARSGQPIPSAQVRVGWTLSELEGGTLPRRVSPSGAVSADLEGARIRSHNQEIEVTADGSGFFRVCGVPVDTQLNVHGRSGEEHGETSLVVRDRVATQDIPIKRR